MLAVVAASVLLLWAGAASALAAVYCVDFTTPPGDCTNSGYNDMQLQMALDDAGLTAANDTVRIAPGSYTNTGDFSYPDPAGGGTVSIEGSGQAQTTLTTTLQAATDQSVLTLLGAGNSVSDLTILIPAPPDVSPSDQGLVMTFATATRVSVLGPAADNAHGVEMGGGTFQSGTVDLQVNAPSGNRAIFASGNQTIQGTTIQSTTGFGGPGSGGTTTIDRSTIKAKATAVGTDAGTVQVSNSIIDLGNNNSAVGLSATNFNASTAPMTINADHVTIAGGGANSIGARARANNATVAQTATVTLENSIVSGPAVPLRREADNNGTANLTTSYSNYPSAGIVDTNDPDGMGMTGMGSLTQTNHTELAPGFVDPASGNYHLASGSALIDIGDPATPVGADAMDIDGDIRPIDGNDDGTARRDIGADEFFVAPPPQPPQPDTDPPETEITKAPKNRTEKTKAKYKFSSDEPGSSFECAFDKQVKKNQFSDCDSPQKYKRLDDGKHKFQVRAIDPAGNLDPTPDGDKFRVLD